MPPETPQTAQVSIVIVTHNSLPAFTNCLTTLPQATSGLRVETIQVDNASRDGSPGEAARLGVDVTVIRAERNLGFAAACNRGAAEASGEYLLFLNPDVQPDPGSVATLYEAARGQADAGLVSGRLRFPDGSFQATCRELPRPGNLFRARGSWLYRLLGRDVDSEERYTLGDRDTTTKVPAVAGTMVMVERDVFTGLGGFDERFFLFMEDTDLSKRALDAGLVNLFVPGAGGVHGLGQGSSIGRFRRNRHQAVAVWKYFLKHCPNGFSVIVLPVLLAVNLLLQALTPPVRRH